MNELCCFCMEEFQCHQPEVDDEPSPGPVPRPAGKTPLSSKRRPEPEEDDEFPERPDLIEIFDDYDVPEDERIQLCATTAAYYRAKNKKRKAPKN